MGCLVGGGLTLVETGQVPAQEAFQGVPGIYLLLLCDVVRRLGHDEQQVIEGLGVTRAGLLQPDSRIFLLTGFQAAQRAVALAGHQGLGLIYARAMNVTMHGSLGMLALASPNIGEALQAAMRFMALRVPFLRVELQRGTTQWRIVFSPRVALGEPEAFVMEAVLVGLAHVAEQLLGRPLQGGRIHMPGPQPSYWAQFRASLPAPIHYETGEWALLLPVSLSEARPRLADPVAAGFAREQCEQEYRQLVALQSSVRQQVEEHLRMSDAAQALPTLEEMAQRVHLSPRTLKRRLQELGTSYRLLLDAELRQRCCRLLENRHLSISEVAWQLGFADVSNFTRTFRRLTGCPPRAWRAEQQAAI